MPLPSYEGKATPESNFIPFYWKDNIPRWRRGLHAIYFECTHIIRGHSSTCISVIFFKGVLFVWPAKFTTTRYRASTVLKFEICGKIWSKIGGFGWNRPKKRTMTWINFHFIILFDWEDTVPQWWRAPPAGFIGCTHISDFVVAESAPK
jgi:hypothetical protein